MLTKYSDTLLILLVEDDENHIELIKRSFAAIPEKYHLEVVCTIGAARFFMIQQAPQLIISDYHLPDGDGKELIHLADGSCPVILMTSQGNELIAVDAMKAGALDYVVKSQETFSSMPRVADLALREWDLIQKDKQIYEIISRGKREWEQTFDAVPDLISIINPDHTIKRVNKAMADRCGFKLEELVGRRCCEVVHGMDTPVIHCPATGMLHDGQVHNLEIEDHRLNGFFEVTVSPLFDEENRLTSYVHVMRDITHHKKTDALVHQRLKLRDMAPTSNVGELMQATLDACELLSDSSIGFFHLVDEDQQNLILQAWSSNTLATMCTAEGHGSHYPIEKAGVWAECFHTREPVIHNDYASLPHRKGLPTGHAPVVRELTIPVVLHDKVVSIIGVGNKASPYTKHDVFVVRQFVTFAYEVIGRKQAIVALEASEEKHRKLANEQQVILNTSSVGICFLKDRQVLWSNPVFEKMFGYEEGATYNMETVQLYADLETYEFIGREGYATIESGEIFSQDVVMKKRDGSAIWCNLVGQAVTPGTVQDGSIWVIQDITGRKKLEEESRLLEQKYQQTQRLESLGVLAGGIAHDFNNILTIILGHCHIIHNGIDSGIEPKNHVNQIEKAAGRAADLCRQMLTYAGKNTLVKQSINMWLLVDENVKMFRSAVKKNVTIELGLKHDVPEIKGDSAQIQQVVMNLIINAAEAIGDKNGTVRIKLEKMMVLGNEADRDFFGNAITAGHYACLEVSDDGCGMDPETQKRIFEPFYTTKFTGRGLGMSAVLGIINSHDGALQLFSTPDVGTTFKVYFPLHGLSQAVEIAPKTDSIFSAKGSGSILLVDDEESLRTIGEALLKAMGFSAMTASNGLEALEIYRRMGSGIDLILLDLLMPEMGGIETYIKLREISSSLPIVICSGYAVDGILESMGNDQFTAIVQKPYKPDQLRDTLMRFLNTTEPKFL